MKILMLSQWFEPEPAFKGLLFAKKLKQLGHDVEVLTGFPNYPGGRLYPGYRVKLYQREEIDGIRINRVPLYPSHDSSGFRRILNYVSFALSAAVLGPILTRRPDVIYVYHPPATVGLPAIILSLVHRCPFVYDIQDLWPDTLTATGMVNSKIALQMVRIWCNFTYRMSAAITVLSPGFKRRLTKIGIAENKVKIIYNWDGGDSTQTTKQKDSNLALQLGFENKFNIVFAGTMGRAQKLETVLEVASLLENELPKVQFVFVGDGIQKEMLRNQSATMSLKNTLFLPRLPLSEIGKVLALADVLLVHLKKDPLFEITIPSKTQSYLAAKRPVLMAVAGDGADLVREAEAGLVCESENPKSLADCVRQFYSYSPGELNRIGENGGRFYKENLDVSIGVREFDALLRKVHSEYSKSRVNDN